MNRPSVPSKKIPALLITSLMGVLATSCVENPSDIDSWGLESDSEGEGADADDVDADDADRIDVDHDHDGGDAQILSGVLRASVTRIASTSFSADQLVVNFELENTTDAPLTMLKWGTPFEDIDSDIFEVTYEGEQVEYIGPIAKRGAPLESDYITIAPGQTKSVVVNISERYATEDIGEYRVRYRAMITTRERGVGRVRSNETVSVQHTRLQYPTYQAPRAAGLSFTGCSAEQQAILRRSVGLARSYADSALSNLQQTDAADRADSPRYTTWFGSYTKSRYDDVEANFDAIDAALTTQSISFNCGCDASYYAYVYPHQPYKIWMCDGFWSAADIGTDSRAGALIHEVSHFDAVAGTRDHAYMHSGAQNLANNNPNKAIANADNYEYFAENNAWLAMIGGATGDHNTDGFWGEWGEFSSCSAGKFVYGYRINSASPQGSGDDTGLHDIELYCAKPYSQYFSRIWSAYMDGGSFSNPKFCPGSNNPVVGFDMKIQEKQGSGDDTVANDIDLYCAKGSYISADTKTHWGGWTNVESCPDGQAVTGLITRVQDNQGAGDDTALNGLRLVCSDY